MINEDIEKFFERLKNNLPAIGSEHGKERQQVGKRILLHFEGIVRQLQCYREMISCAEEQELAKNTKKVRFKFIYGVGRPMGPTEDDIKDFGVNIKDLVAIELDRELKFYRDLLEGYFKAKYWPKLRKKRSPGRKRTTVDPSERMFRRTVERVCKKSILEASYWNEEEKRCDGKLDECVDLLSKVQDRRSPAGSQGSIFVLNQPTIIKSQIGDDNVMQNYAKNSE